MSRGPSLVTIEALYTVLAEPDGLSRPLTSFINVTDYTIAEARW